MSDFDRWSRGDLTTEGRPTRTRRRESWQVKHDALFLRTWGEQPARTFPPPRRVPMPAVKPLHHPPVKRNWSGWIIFVMGVLLGFLIGF